MHIIGIHDRVMGAWALCATTVNDLCIQLTKLEKDPDTVSYLVRDIHGVPVRSISEEFGWLDSQFEKFTP